MKLLTVLLGATLLFTSCMVDNNPGCQQNDSYCQNYSGYGWLANPRTEQDLMDECSGPGETYYPGGCPEKNAYAVCRNENYQEDFNFEYVFYTSSLSAGLTVFSENECTILNNN